jgi:hypothetical protein
VGVDCGFRYRIGRALVPTGIILMVELHGDSESRGDVRASPTASTHLGLEPYLEIRQTHPVLADFRNSFFAQMCH